MCARRMGRASALPHTPSHTVLKSGLEKRPRTLPTELAAAFLAVRVPDVTTEAGALRATGS